ncbi:PKD domain-containing protein [Colwellia piezophila]|uniref:PKD domain-containing protein n=1 Tax=Colwellia piezophila TaxID=211668 RepID=UPI00036AEA36|nr:carbohydrate binding domain-containing protein [Colwellia piezophila]
MNKFNKHKLATAIGIICLSSNFSAMAATNLVTNGDFESPLLLDGTVWLPAVKNPVVARFLDPDLSSQVAHISSRKKYSSTIKQIVALEPGKTYNLSGKAKSTEFVGFTWSYQPVGGGNTAISLELVNSGGAWVDINSTFTVPLDDVDPSGDFKIWVLTGQKDADGNNLPVNDLFFDNIVLVEVFDDDSDGVINDDDAFPNDASASLDSDSDGYPDSWNEGKSAADSTSLPALVKDAFPTDAAAYLDTDGDGRPNSWNEGKSQADSTSEPVLELDLFPDDATNGQTDSDLDGVADLDDAFPNDISASIDSDNDGYPDSWTEGKSQADSTSEPVLALDAFAQDAAAYLDTDGDGYPDSWNDGKSVADSTSEPVLALDAFAQDAAAYLDTDGDGYPDSWNEGKSADDSTSEPVLVIDNFPEDATENIDTDGDGVGDNADPFPNDKYDGVIQPGSKLSKADSYENRAVKDYWTAYDILGERLDIMRFHVSASLNLTPEDEAGRADYPDVDAWLAVNPDWKWSTPEQFTALHGFYDAAELQDNIDAFLMLTGDQWSTWSRPGKPSKWLVLTKDTSVANQSNLPVLKYTVTEEVFNEVATGTEFKLGNSVNAAALLVRVVNFDPNADDDDDGVKNGDDHFPNDPLEWQDSDGDGVGDNGDVFPNDPNESGDADGDGIGDNADTDADNDGIPNELDAFPIDSEQSLAVNIVGLEDTTEGESLTIDASGTAMGDEQLTYSWQQISGSDLSVGESGAILVFDALPNVMVDEEIVLKLTVSNGVHTVTENVSFMIKAIPSFVTVQASLIGGEQVEDASGAMKTMLKPGTTIELDGSASDSLDANLTYQWRQTRGPVIKLINANQAKASFVVPSKSSDSKVGFKLVVSNGQSHEEATAVAVVSAEIETRSDSGGSFGLWSLLLVGVALFKKKTIKIINTRVRGSK